MKKFSAAISLVLIFALVLSGVSVPTPKQRISLFSLPLNRAANSLLWDHIFGNGGSIAGIITTPSFTGLTWSLNIGCGTNCTGTVYLDHVGVDSDGGYCPSLATTNFSDMEASFDLVTAKGKENNVILQGASFTNNNATTPGVFGQHFADNLNVGCGSAMNPILFRANLTQMATNDYICVGGVWPSCTGGNYWINTAVITTNSDPDDSHATLAVSIPACIIPGTTSSPCTDGNANLVLVGSHAPLQDVWCDSNTTGVTQLNACNYNLAGDAQIANVSGQQTGEITTSSPPNSVVGETGNVTGSASGLYDCTGVGVTATITAVTSTQIWYTCSSTLGGNRTDANLTAGVWKSKSGHYLNSSSTNSSQAIAANQLPIPWEMPIKVWREYFDGLVAAQWAIGNTRSIGYKRHGKTKSGESDTANCGSWPIWTVVSNVLTQTVVGNTNCQKIFLSYTSDLLKVEMANGCGIRFDCNQNVHSYGPQEATYAFANGEGWDNNALGVLQVTQLIGGFCATLAAQTPDSHSGDWCNARLLHLAPMYTGQRAMLTLQTGGIGNYGTPANCQPGYAGSMAYDLSCVSYGTVSSSGSTVTITLAGGPTPSSQWASSINPASIDIAGVPYVVTGFTDSTHITVTGTPAASGAAFTFPDPFTLAAPYPGYLAEARLMGATNIELYVCEYLLAYDTSYSSLSGAQCPTTYSQATYQAGYKQALFNFLNPNRITIGTTAIVGKVVKR